MGRTCQMKPRLNDDLHIKTPYLEQMIFPVCRWIRFNVQDIFRRVHIIKVIRRVEEIVQPAMK